MANELQPLSLLFQNKLFRIPDYQRGYAWQQSQLTDFWDDLINLQDGRYHYTGLLSLKNLKSSEITSWGSDLWMVSKGFRYGFLIFFLAMFGNILFQTYLVGAGVHSLKEFIKLFWTIRVPWGWTYTAGLVPDWIAQFAFGFYQVEFEPKFIPPYSFHLIEL